VVKKFSKTSYSHAVLYSDPNGGLYLIKKCNSPSEAFDLIFNYQGTLDKSNMSIYACPDVPNDVIEMSEQDFLATVRHPVQRHFSKKPGMIINKHKMIY